MRKLPKTITESEFLEGVKKVRKNHHKAAFVLGFYQCMRVSEVVSLKKEDLDVERGFIHIKNAKGGRDRDVPIMKPAQKALKYVPVGVKRVALHNAVKRYWPDCHFHTLRHSGATFYLQSGVGIRYIQELLGHSRLDTTQIYTHVTPEALKEVFSQKLFS